MVSRMKTTVEIPDALAEEAKAVASREKTTLRALIEEGLRDVLARRDRRDRFVLRDSAIDGRGTRPGVAEGDWESVGEVIYRGRGS